MGAGHGEAAPTAASDHRTSDGRGWESVPRVTQFDEADALRVTALRQQYKADYEQRGTRLTVTPFLVKAVAVTLRNHPVLNASLDPTGENVVLKQYVHLGMAWTRGRADGSRPARRRQEVAARGVARARELARKARERTLTAEDMKGGTFTISNQGGIGGGHFTPIVNVPEAAILGVGRGGVRPAWIEGKIEPRTYLPLALSYDHRLIDGGTAARFISDLVKAIEQFPETLVKP